MVERWQVSPGSNPAVVSFSFVYHKLFKVDPVSFPCSLLLDHKNPDKFAVILTPLFCFSFKVSKMETNIQLLSQYSKIKQ